jgi:hypothetical protein
MKKKVVNLLALVALLLPLSAMAESVQCLVLTESNGAVSKFALTDAPVVTYSGSDMVVSCGDQTMTVGLEGLTLTFGEMETTRIETVKDGVTESDRLQFSFGEASFEGLQPGALVNVYSIDGKMQTKVKADQDGRASVSLMSLPKGVYILRTPTKSFKIKN